MVTTAKKKDKGPPRPTFNSYEDALWHMAQNQEGEEYVDTSDIHEMMSYRPSTTVNAALKKLKDMDLIEPFTETRGKRSAYRVTAYGLSVADRLDAGESILEIVKPNNPGKDEPDDKPERPESVRNLPGAELLDIPNETFDKIIYLRRFTSFLRHDLGYKLLNEDGREATDREVGEAVARNVGLSLDQLTEIDEGLKEMTAALGDAKRQKVIAQVLNIPLAEIEHIRKVTRSLLDALGGFGGKD